MDISKVIKESWPDEIKVISKLGFRGGEEHADHVLVRFASLAMKEKLATARHNGRGGWWSNNCDTEHLKQMLKEHVDKGDMRDVMNLAAMIFYREAAEIESLTE